MGTKRYPFAQVAMLIWLTTASQLGALDAIEPDPLDERHYSVLPAFPAHMIKRAPAYLPSLAAPAAFVALVDERMGPDAVLTYRFDPNFSNGATSEDGHGRQFYRVYVTPVLEIILASEGKTIFHAAYERPMRPAVGGIGTAILGYIRRFESGGAARMIREMFDEMVCRGDLTNPDNWADSGRPEEDSDAR